MPLLVEDQWRQDLPEEYGLAHHPRDVQGDKAFKKVIDRFLETGSIHPKSYGRGTSHHFK